jgi:hypothetical protein
MERYRSYSYAWAHETPSNNSPLGAPPPASHTVLETRQASSRSRAQSRRGKEFRLALGANLPAARATRLARQTNPWSSFVPFRGREGLSCPHPTPRRPSRGVSERVVDPRAHRHSNSAPVSCLLPSPCNLAALAGDGLELPDPERRACQRAEAAIARWRRYRWPHIKKSHPVGGALGFPG